MYHYTNDIYIYMYITTVTTYILSDIYIFLVMLYVCGRKKSYASTRVEAGAVKSWKSQKKDRWPMTGGYHGVYLIKVYKSSFGDGLLM